LAFICKDICKGRARIDVRVQTYDDLLQLAQICAKNAHSAISKEVAVELWRMALEYRDRAAKVDGGKAPEIGEPPFWLTR
jgi:hypothetical protein